MSRVIVTAGKGFDDQATVQMAMLDLKKQHPEATIIVSSSSKGEVMATKIWKLLGGIALVQDPEWKRLGSAAGSTRDQKVVDRGAMFCISLVAEDGSDGYITNKCRIHGITIREYRAGQQIVNATAE